MGWKFNPFTGALDQTGSGGGSSVIEGEVDTYNDLPLDGSAALNSSWLVRTASGSWFTGGSKPAGIYVRVNTAGSSRDNDYVYAGLLPSAFSDSELKIYDQGDSTKTAQFQLSGIATGQNRVVSLPDKNITLDDSGDSRTPAAHAASHAAAGSDPVFDQNLNTNDVVTFQEAILTNLVFSGAGLIANSDQDASIVLNAGTVRISGSTTVETFGNFTILDVADDPTIYSATFDAQNNLTANRTYDLPDASGTLALTSDIPANTIASTLVDAKGDLIVGTAADTVARLPVGATNGHVLTVDSAEAGGMKWAAASGGVSAVGASAADILSVSGSDLVADDPNADRLVFWDDSAGALKYLTAGSGLTITDTTITASGGVSAMQSIAVGFVLN